ncbi:hypothetical protein ACIQBJ_13765 [Kitasatospora sp. NPDC088391]|uniref:hypothetical protein n=1 Tax=Kitasatospora sp. NPDC088391 TaxID=3364074 RepID=UPI00382F2A2C
MAVRFPNANARVAVKAACRVTTTRARLHIDLLRVTTALCRPVPALPAPTPAV